MIFTISSRDEQYALTDLLVRLAGGKVSEGTDIPEVKRVKLSVCVDVSSFCVVQLGSNRAGFIVQGKDKLLIQYLFFGKMLLLSVLMLGMVSLRIVIQRS